MTPALRPPWLLRPSTWAAPYVGLWALVGLAPIQPTDLDLFFWPSARVAVMGHPLLVYSLRGDALYPNANGPVALVPLTLVGFLLNTVGWLDATTQRRTVALAVFSIFLILMAREAVAAIERMRGAQLAGAPRLIAFAILTLGPPIWQSVAGYGHIEQPIEIWLVLVSVRWLQGGKPLRAGIAFALAVLARSSSVLLVVPLTLSGWRRGASTPARLLAAAGATGVAALLPLLLADRADVVHSLFTYRGNLLVGAGSIWSITRGSAIEPVVQHWDVAAVVAVLVMANLWLASRPGGLDESRTFAGMTLCAASFALLAKTVWPYYFFEVFVFGTVWAVGRWKSSDGIWQLAFIPIAISTYGMVAEIGSEQGLPDPQINLEGAAMFALLAPTAAWILWLAAKSRAGMPAGPTTFKIETDGKASERAGPR